MNNLYALAILFSLLIGCRSGQTQKAGEDSIPVENILSLAEKNTGQIVVVSGWVNHVCSHSGQRCFLADESGDHSIRVEAGGEIENFARELLGTSIKVTGRLMEERMTVEEIDQWEQQYLEKHPEETENNGENCSAERANINQMRAWMKEHGKNYYAIYYIEGQSYESLV